MFRFLKTYFAGKTSARPSRSLRRSFRPTLEAFEDRLVPSTLTVTSPLDNGAAGTLRVEVNQANYDAARGVSDTIVFSPSMAGKSITLNDPLVFTPGKGTVTIDNTNLYQVISSKSGSVFWTDYGSTVVMDNLSIENANGGYYGGGIVNNGILTLNGCGLYDDSATYGGAIYNNNELILENCTFMGNHATFGGAIDNVGELSVGVSCNFSSNTAVDGGAIANQSSLIVNGNYVNFQNNSATGYGGAIYNNGYATVIGATFNDNSANYGGAIFNYQHLTVSSSTFDYNHANDYGGAIYSAAGSYYNLSLSYYGNTAGIADPLWDLL